VHYQVNCFGSNAAVCRNVRYPRRLLLQLAKHCLGCALYTGPITTTVQGVYTDQLSLSPRSGTSSPLHGNLTVFYCRILPGDRQFNTWQSWYGALCTCRPVVHDLLTPVRDQPSVGKLLTGSWKDKAASGAVALIMSHKTQQSAHLWRPLTVVSANSGRNLIQAPRTQLYAARRDELPTNRLVGMNKRTHCCLQSAKMHCKDAK